MPFRVGCAPAAMARTSNLTHRVERCDNRRTMKHQKSSPITEALLRAIVNSGMAYKALERETGVKRSSIQRFVDGRQSIRLDMADRLAAYFGLGLAGRLVCSSTKIERA